MSTLSLEKVTKRFGSNVALNNVSLEVHDREFVVLLGPTGAGKTTLLRCVAGLEKMDSGDVLIGGGKVKTQTPPPRRLTLVFPKNLLFSPKNPSPKIPFSFETPPRTQHPIKGEG